MNIDVARKRGLLLREDFYSDVNLKKYLGAMVVERFGCAGEKCTEGWINDLGRMIGPQILDNGTRIKGFSFKFWWRITDAGLVDASLSMNLRPVVEFNDVERIFGPSWKLTEPFPNPDEVPTTQTRPHGNEKIEYEYLSTGKSQLLRFGFNANATLNAFSVFAREIR